MPAHPPPAGVDRPEDLAAKIATALDRLARASRRHRQEVAGAHGLTPLQADLLAVLADGAPPAPVVGLLADELALTQPTVTESIRSLERKGLVQRAGDPQDRRRTTVHLTATGRRVATDLTTHRDSLVEEIAALTPQVQAETLLTTLTLIAGLVDRGSITVARTCLTCRSHERHGDQHRCTLLQAVLPPAQLRVNCPEHRSA